MCSRCPKLKQSQQTNKLVNLRIYSCDETNWPTAVAAATAIFSGITFTLYQRQCIVGAMAALFATTKKDLKPLQWRFDYALQQTGYRQHNRDSNSNIY